MDFLPAGGARSSGLGSGGFLPHVARRHRPCSAAASNAAAFTSRNTPMTAARRRVVWKILVAALVGIPWIPIAAALYAWSG
jgi:hypothetical protein